MRKTLVALIGACVGVLAVAAYLRPVSAAQDAAGGGPAPLSPAQAPRRVKVLFLGDDGHHNPIDRCRQIHSTFGRRGIDIDYTDDLRDLTPANLGRYDALLVYANIERIAPEQERAILDFFAGGKGFVPVHCGSYCFLNSPKLTALTGGRFKSHGTGTFKEVYVRPDHPVLQGLKAVESWDESYVHEMHNEQDRTVLSVRVEGEKREPYTWVRNEGKGRVFYTAWGHDERTWGNVDFQALLERGVRWAAGDWALQPPPAHKPFEFTEGRLPNYLAGEKWGTLGDVITQVQKPLDPAESMRHMAVPPGFEVRLVASEPDVKKPICMTFDERGRLWVAETYDYPNELQPEGSGRDRITVCEDTDGDGRSDKFTVFADKLSIPTSMLHATGGLMVAQAPHTLLLRDTDGDGKADERKVLFTGWGTDDTHAGPSNLRWGLDGWVYGTVGYSGFRGEVGGKAIRFSSGVFRFRPDGSALEFLGSTNNNTWGLGITEDFEVFASTANRNPAFYLNIPNRYFEGVRGLSPRRNPAIADDWHFWPVGERVRQVDVHGGYTAGAGAAFYTARSFPQGYWNRVNFVAEPTGHLLGQFAFKPDGAGFIAQNRFNLLASTDEWTSPIAAEVGPDGAVWMIDWYNIVVQHNPIPKGFEKGKGNAYETPLRDKRHGRVYRIAFTGGKPSQAYDLSKASADQLVAALRSDNMLWRTHAHRLLAERGQRDVVPALLKLTADQSVDPVGLNAPAIHALWLLANLGALDGSDAAAGAAVTDALGHPSAAVRKTALNVLPRDAAAVGTIAKAKSLTDPEPLVRKAALLALAAAPPSEEAGRAVYQLLATLPDPKPKALPAKTTREPVPPDTSLADAATIAAARHDAGFLRAALAAHTAPPGSAEQSVPEQVGNALPNPSFEAEQDGRPTGWQPATYSGAGKFEWAAEGRTGGHSVVVRSDGAGGDIGWKADVRVEPQTDYRLSAWIKTQDLKKIGAANGALLNVHNLQGVKTPAVAGTTDWKRVEVVFNTRGESRLTINCLFGGWGRATGTAWYDDVELVKVGRPPLPGAVGRAVATVTGHFAERAPSDAIVPVLSAVKAADPALAAAVVDGLAAGWPEGKAPTLADADVAEVQAVMKALPARAKDRMIALAERWGRRDLFGGELASLVGELQAAVADGSVAPNKRAEAARRLVAVADAPQSVDLIVKQVTPQAAPDLQLGLLSALGESRVASVGDSLVQRYGTLTPTAQKAALALLLRKPQWTMPLLRGVESGAVNPKDLLPQQWQALTTHPDADVKKLATALQKSTGRAPTADRKGIVDKLMPVAQQPGDAAKGRLVFERNCIVCHRMDDKGGAVGPDLTGVGAKPKADNLIEIIDPNRSVEGTYRQWTAKLPDDVITGRLAAESQTTIEILDAAGQRHEIRRDQLKGLTASDRSVMPEGFEQLPPQDLADLLEYLGTSKVKH